MGIQLFNFGIAIYVEGGAYNVIGGDRTIGVGPIGQGNLISSNDTGIDLLVAGGNIIKGNIIGTDVMGNELLGNRAAGINFEGNLPDDTPPDDPAHNIIGPDNIIANNGESGGIGIEGVLYPIIITANAIYDNGGPGINYNLSDAVPDTSAAPPVIRYFELASGIVNGSTCKDCVVEVFSTDTKDGKVYEGTVTADAFGNFSFNKGEALSGPFLTATTTPPGGSTSEFSPPTSTRSAVQIALDVIQSKAPLYQTSFDDGDNALGFLELGRDARMENGKLMVTSSGSHVSAGLDIPDSDRFAVEFELLISDASPQGHCPFYTENDEAGSSYRGTATVFHMSGETTFDLNMPEGIDPVHLATSTFDVSKTNRITLIILGDQAAAFIDGRLAYTAFNPDMMTFYKTIYFAATATSTCEYDNYKFWDLSGVNLNP